MLTIEFGTPFDRGTLRASVQALVLLHPSLTYSFRASARWDLFSDLPDAESDEIIGLKVDGFTDLAKLGAFIADLPAGAYARITELSFQP